MKIYIVKYCANECDDFSYESPYPIFYSLDKKKARDFFEDLREKCTQHFNDWINSHPELRNNEDYQFTKNDNDCFKYSMGKWSHTYEYCEDEMNVDLRFN